MRFETLLELEAKYMWQSPKNLLALSVYTGRCNFLGDLNLNLDFKF